MYPNNMHAEFMQVRTPRPFAVPRDHGAHYNFPTEWWYFTGHLKGSQGTFGFEVTFFRIGVTTAKSDQQTLLPRSLFVGHFAITDDRNETFYHSEILERDSIAEVAGASESTLHVWINDWTAKMVSEKRIELSAHMDAAALSLALRPAKKLVLHGNKGLSQKGATPGDASYYSSFTRMGGSGTLSLPDRPPVPVEVIGAWMDHEVLSSKTGPDAAGWDWFALQLDTNQELMLYHLKDSAGKISPFSSGSFIDTDGSVRHLTVDDFQIRTLSEWTSPTTGITYPSKWKLHIPSLQLSMTVEPTIPDQELITKKTTGITYWEGRSTVSGSLGSKPVSGNAYVELVGYQP